MGQKKIFGIDVCQEALELARKGELVSIEHLSICPICQRRFTIVRADTEGWTPISHQRATELMETMVANFVRNEEVAKEDRTGFYAHLAKCEDCEGDFASMIAAELSPDPQGNTTALDAWWATLPERLKAHREHDSATDDSQQ